MRSYSLTTAADTAAPDDVEEEEEDEEDELLITLGTDAVITSVIVETPVDAFKLAFRSAANASADFTFSK